MAETLGIPAATDGRWSEANTAHFLLGVGFAGIYHPPPPFCTTNGSSPPLYYSVLSGIYAAINLTAVVVGFYMLYMIARRPSTAAASVSTLLKLQIITFSVAFLSLVVRASLNLLL